MDALTLNGVFVTAVTTDSAMQLILREHLTIIFLGLKPDLTHHVQEKDHGEPFLASSTSPQTFSSSHS